MAEDWSLANAIDAAGWLLLDVSDYLKMCRSDTLSAMDQQQRRTLNTKIFRQIRRLERYGDPLEVVPKVRQMLQEAQGGTARSN